MLFGLFGIASCGVANVFAQLNLLGSVRMFALGQDIGYSDDVSPEYHDPSYLDGLGIHPMYSGSILRW